MAPRVSVVVVAHDMARELPRTLRTLTAPYQRGITAGEIEVVVVDNGSRVPVGERELADLDPAPVLVRIDDALPSPARAANHGIERASADLVGLVVDGARMATPGLLARALLAGRVAERPVVASLAWHLGVERQMSSSEKGYDQLVEDEVLAGIDWESDGYTLFSVSTLAGSSGRGWFGPMGESSALFLPKVLWRDSGGLDERFDLPGGGLVNHDLYRRVCGLPGVQLVVLLGEGTFHQFHGGAATSGAFSWETMHDQYRAIRGEPYRPPANEPLYLGTMPFPALPHVAESARLALDRGLRRGTKRRNGEV